jgi:hypothetical protein
MRSCKGPLILASLLWLAETSGVASQGTHPSRTQTSLNSYCESNIANLDAAHAEASEDGLIIAVARLGNGERNRVLNHRRLYNLRTYLEKFRKRTRETIVTAEGERVEGPGRVEVYVKGKLLITLELRRGQDLHVGSCDATSKLDMLFYDSRNRSGRGVYIPPR